MQRCWFSSRQHPLGYIHSIFLLYYFIFYDTTGIMRIQVVFITGENTYKWYCFGAFRIKVVIKWQHFLSIRFFKFLVFLDGKPLFLLDERLQVISMYCFSLRNVCNSSNSAITWLIRQVKKNISPQKELCKSRLIKLVLPFRGRSLAVILF